MITTTKAFYGSRFSPNQTMTPDGFLIAHNVPIARTGWYHYLGHEIGLPHSNDVMVYRDPDEVFSPAAMASFEGKPLTDGHPMDGVNPDNAQTYVKGAVQNVRRGKGDESDLLLADLIVYDKILQDEIRAGKREVSAGYDCEYEPLPNGGYAQKNIVGNHVAVVEKGRAGDRVRIKDQRSIDDADELVKQAEEASRKYGIAVKKDGHRTPPKGYPDDREQYGDPVNYKYPLTGEHKQAAVEYYNHPDEREKGGYTTEEWAKIGRRIVEKLGSGYELKDGKILTPADRGRQKGADSMGNRNKPPLKKRSRVTDWLAAKGLKYFAMDAEPDEIAETVDAMVEERRDEDEPEGREDEKKTQDDAEDQERLKALEAQVAELKSLLEKALSSKTSDDEKSPEEKIQDAIQQMEDPESTEEESHTIDPTQIQDSPDDEPGPVAPPEDRPKNGFSTADSAAAKAFLKRMLPAIAAIKDPAEKKRMADAALAAVKAPAPRNTYADISRAIAQRKTADAQRQEQQQEEDWSQLGRKWAEERNPHYKKKA
ncbi:MAG: DUF2213 domain-containing protein [Alicyclobacillus sp.]|nr:DUF2213 domain-containing protein [Alicyclobacillus sp.]